MKKKTVRTIFVYFTWFLAFLALHACRNQAKPVVVPSLTPSLTAAGNSQQDLPTLGDTPTPTMVPAIVVNGEVVSVAEYEGELSRFRAAIGTEMATITEEDVLNDIINQLLLAQGARENGFVADEKTVQERIEQLNIGEEAFRDWLQEHGYTENEFRMIFKRAIEAAWMRDMIADSVPETAEQIHARQILLYDEDEANSVYAQLQSGADFETLARKYDPVAGGDLGWFPRGFLLHPELDSVIFALGEGEFSKVLKTDAGFHIIQVLEKDLQHRLNYDALKVLRHKAVDEWLSNKREESEIVINLP